VHIENGRLPDGELPLPTDRPIVVHCASAFRSTAASSVLQRRGFDNVVLLDGGFDEWRGKGYEVSHTP
jgi:rhodanese-related sulfurtransferase